MNRLGFALLLAGLIGSSAGGMAAPRSRPKPPPFVFTLAMLEHLQIFGADKVPEMLHQCSRDTPAAGEGSWTPDIESIKALERLLPDVLRKQQRDRSWNVFPRQWVRQYVGIVRGGRRYLYGNYIPEDVGTSDAVIIVCDGGASFFGAEYDVEAGTITHLAFNGVT